MTRLGSLLFLALLGLPFLASAAETEHHYLCRFTVTEAGLSLEEMKAVPTPLSKSRFVWRTRTDFRFTLLDTQGAVLHRGGFRDPRRLSGEFKNADGTQEHARLTRNEGALLLELPPFSEGTTLRIEKRVRTVKDGKVAVNYAPFATLPLTPPKSAEAAAPAKAK